MMDNAIEPGLIELIKRGGGFHIIPGAGPQELLINLIGGIYLPPSVDRTVLLNAVLEREALMSTAVGSGIALPHPRNPLITDPAEQFVTLAYTEQGLNWEALDGKPVHTVMLIVSASAKMHLHTLSRINFFCQQESFRALLGRRAPEADILKAIEEIEQTWKNS
ncbi:PTS sugar transporter subunit IIA [Treponema primitia]|uniref:PTS sugar transporter subunit IIA n=1 Tax=Treponema primitia TaxID=88058 RepID=UPI00397F514E